jgi:hypothetical protein
LLQKLFLQILRKYAFSVACTTPLISSIFLINMESFKLTRG